MNNSLKIKVNTKLYSVELFSDQPVEALKEINKFLTLANEELDNIKEIDLLTDLDYDQFYFVPNDLRNNNKIMEFITQQLEMTEGRIYRKQMLPSMKLINFENKEVNVEVDVQALKNTLKKLRSDINSDQVKSCLLHIKGKVNKETKQLIEDQFIKDISYAPTKTVHTKANIPELLVEAVYFGDFPEEF